MDFIERIFHINVDGGSGALEAFCVGVVGFAIATIAVKQGIRFAVIRDCLLRKGPVNG
jgi:hypothetical protein